MTFDYDAQPKEHLTACNLCGGHRFEDYGHKDRYGLPVSSMRCLDCSLVFINPRMTRQAYQRFYRDGIYRELLSGFYETEFTPELIEEAQEKYAVKLLMLLDEATKCRQIQRVFDIGGSTGVIAEALVKAWDCDVMVLEPSEAEAKRAVQRGLPVMIGTIEDFEPDGQQFDLILMCQTIDHLTNVAGSLRTIRALLEDDGLLFCDVVNGGPIKVDHPFRLTEKTATDYFRRAGFKYSCEPDPDGLHVNYLCGRA